MQTKLRWILIAGVSLGCVWPATAFDFEQAARDSLSNPSISPLPEGWAVGPALYVAGKTYKGEDTEYFPVPAVFYRGDKLTIYVKQASYLLWQEGELELSGIADLRLDGYSDDDSDYLDGMDDRHMTLDAGLELEIGIPLGEIEITVLTDTLFQHEGQEATVAYAAPIIIERLFIKPSIGVSYISSNLADYYFGVKSSEARPGRPSYDVGDTWGWSAGVVSNYRIHENWLLMFLLEYEGFSDDVKDSPIVSEDGEFNLMLGAAWNF